jgi:hypothetical protein
MPIHRLRHPPDSVPLTQEGVQTLYVVELSARPSPAWRAARTAKELAAQLFNNLPNACASSTGIACHTLHNGMDRWRRDSRGARLLVDVSAGPAESRNSGTSPIALNSSKD